MSQQSNPYRTNRDLFSNHYLTEHLRQTEPWKEVDEDLVRKAYDEINELWEDKQDRVEDYNEAQLERNFIRPVFEILEIPFEIEETVMRNARRPDYGFFPSVEAADAAFDRENFYEESIAVADAKRWGRKLDTRGEEKRDFENPSYQIHRYLQETPTRWAVLTNGEKWRLYYGPTSHRLDSYYEIDLPKLLSIVGSEGGLEEFKEFYLFFRQTAFLPDQTGDCFLDDVYDESSVFAEELGEDLQENIYEAIRVLAEGFLDTNDDLSEKDLDLIHDSSLIYLYRLIFVLYAESEGRNLLPTDNEIYSGSYSLNELKQIVVENRNKTQQQYQTWQTDLWDQLDQLFVLIDQGSQGQDIPKEDLYIPAYNGGLFRTNPDDQDSQEAQFLSEYEAGDAYIAEVIELLTRHDASEGDGKVFVDYSSLDERNLGSIYEGLLEYKLDVADEPLTVDDGQYSPADEDDAVTVEEGDVYLRTDDGERKATGSYYTPEYVVEYMVDETLGPLIDDIREDMLAESARGDERGFAKEFADRVFDLTVLDPAMGSGHFPVNAVDYLAREIINAQEQQERQALDSENGQVQPPTTDEGELRDINWARRKVAQRCIYGVDVNPLATELAKVSLWLRTLAAEQPLAFLDHHLKTGNSLVGSDIEDVLSDGDDTETEDGQLTLQQSFDHTRQRAMEHVTDRFQDLLNIDNETLEDAKEMEAVYDDVRADPLYKKLLAMANVHTADEFGLDVPSDADERMARALHSDAWEKIEQQDWFKSAQAIAEEERFFHWELEFPIAFYDQDGERKADAGFDAVIGNPPYVRQEQLKSNKPYFESCYNSYHGVADLYVYFFEKGIDVLNKGGQFGYISSNKFMKSNYGSPLRSLLSENIKLHKIIDFGELPVFDQASTFPVIIQIENTTPENNSVNVSKVKSLQFNSLSALVDDISYSTPQKILSSEQWVLAASIELDILDKINENGIILEKYSDGEMYRGIVTGLNDVFIIDEQTKNEIESVNENSKEIIKPLIKGDYVRQYHIRDEKKYLIFTRRGINIEDYPAVKSYLESYRKKLEPRPPDVDNQDWEGRKPGNYQWYEIQDTIDYWDVFEQDKIVYPDIAKESRFALDQDGYYPANTVYTIPKKDLYLLSILNSPIIYYYMQRKSSVLGDAEEGGRLRFFGQYMENLPIPSIEFTTPDSERTEALSRHLRLYNDFLVGESTIPVPQKEDVSHDFLIKLAEKIIEFKEKRDDYNTSLLDHLGNYDDGQSLSEVGLAQPSHRAVDSILQQTTIDKPNLRVGTATVERESSTTVDIQLTARYKPVNKEKYETDQWGYAETVPKSAFRITDLTRTEADLIEAFVPVAVNSAGGFANFRETATKTNSLVDRLRKLTLPCVADIEAGLSSYVQTKERAEELEKKMEKTDTLINKIVYDLYNLTDEEIAVVEEAVGDD